MAPLLILYAISVTFLLFFFIGVTEVATTLTAVSVVLASTFVAAASISAVDAENGIRASSTRLEDEVTKLGHKLSEIKKLNVYRFSRRSDFDVEYWKEQIINAGRRPSKKTELILVGRTLHKWIEEPFADLFAETIINILRAEGSVRMLTWDTNGDAWKMFQGYATKDLSRLAADVDKFIAENVLPALSQTERTKLVRKTMDRVHLTFTMFRSDAVVWVSPYLSVSDTTSNIALACGLNSPVAQALLEDVNNMWKLHPEAKVTAS